MEKFIDVVLYLVFLLVGFILGQKNMQKKLMSLVDDIKRESAEAVEAAQAAAHEASEKLAAATAPKRAPAKRKPPVKKTAE